jgi:hypothetical protein
MLYFYVVIAAARLRIDIISKELCVLGFAGTKYCKWDSNCRQLPFISWPLEQVFTVELLI